MPEQKKQEEHKEKRRQHHAAPPFWEWIVAALGLVLVIGAISATTYRAITEKDTPPILEVAVDSIEPAGTGFLVKFTVKNTGTQTAAELNVEGELRRGAESVETSNVTLTYAPANSQREGGLFFTKNPREHELTIRATGYQKP